jgi:hypothetical protein
VERAAAVLHTPIISNFQAKSPAASDRARPRLDAATADQPAGVWSHGDRLDAVAGAAAHFQRAMMMDVDQAAKAMRDEEMLAEIEDFIEGFNGVRVQTWSSQRGMSGL